MTHANSRWRLAAGALGLVLCGCGGGGGAGSSDSPAAVAAADDAPALVAGDPDAPVLQPGEPVTAMAVPSCPPAQGASANNSMNAFYTPANAFDGSMSTWWVGASGAGAWDLYYGFPTVRQMESLNVTFYGTTYVPTQVRLKVSTDGCTWTDKGLMTGGSKPSAAVNQSVRYFWIEMTGNPGSGRPLVRDVDWVQPQDNTGASGGPGSNEAYYFPANAFDGAISTWWVGKSGAGAWNIYYMFNTPRVVQMVTANMYSINYRPANVKLHVSNNGQNWTDLGEMEPGGSPHQFVGQTTQYLWLEMIGNPPSNYPIIKDISFDIPAGASSGDSTSNFYSPGKAFDGNPSTWWAGAQGQTEWDLFYQYAAGTFIASADIAFYAATHAPADVTVYTSMDGDFWTAQGSAAGAASVSVPVGVTCKYLRLHLSGAPSVGYPVIRDIALQTAGTGAWMEVSPGSASGNGIVPPGRTTGWVRMDSDPSGNPYVSWVDFDYTNATNILASHWNGSAWSGFGGSDTTPGIADLSTGIFLSDIAVSGGTTPYVALNDDFASSDGAIHLLAWNGFAWAGLGGSDTGYGLSTGVSETASEGPAVTLDASGNPLVAWKGVSDDAAYSSKVSFFLKKWNGTAWAGLGGSASGGGINHDVPYAAGFPPLFDISRVKVIVDSTGRTIVAWSQQQQQSNSFDIYARRWNGSVWESMGGSDTGGGISGTARVWQFDMAKNSQAAPTLVWNDFAHQGSGMGNIYVRQWNGASWVELGNSASGPGISSDSLNNKLPSVVLDSTGRPIVTWFSSVPGIHPYEVHLYAKRWTGTQWEEMGGSATGTGIAIALNYNDSEPAITLDSGGNPVVAYPSLFNGQGVVYVKKWVP